MTLAVRKEHFSRHLFVGRLDLNERIWRSFFEFFFLLFVILFLGRDGLRLLIHFGCDQRMAIQGRCAPPSYILLGYDNNNDNSHFI